MVLQNRAAYFALDPEHPNRLEAGKKPAHTLIASLAFRDGKPWQVLGCMGADGQPHSLEITVPPLGAVWLRRDRAIGQ